MILPAPVTSLRGNPTVHGSLAPQKRAARRAFRREVDAEVTRIARGEIDFDDWAFSPSKKTRFTSWHAW